MYGYIYKTTNLINNKIYVGQKKSNKFLGNKYLGSGKRLRSAIISYGKDNFIVQLVDVAESLQELNDKEIFWTKFLDSTNSSIGYNIAYGGLVWNVPAWNKGLTVNVDTRLIQSKQTREKRSKSLKKAYSEGRHKINFSPEVRAVMSQKAKDRLHPPTTAGRKSITNGFLNKMINVEDFYLYENNGWYFGKVSKQNKPAWNKGLTKYTDSRVNKYTQTRIKNNIKKRGELLETPTQQDNQQPSLTK